MYGLAEIGNVLAYVGRMMAHIGGILCGMLCCVCTVWTVCCVCETAVWCFESENGVFYISLIEISIKIVIVMLYPFFLVQKYCILKPNIEASRGAGAQIVPVNRLVVSIIFYFLEWGSNPQPVDFVVILCATTGQF